MTCVAWDGRTLAADKRAVNGGMFFTVSKLFRVNGSLVAGAGAFDRIHEMVKWLREGADPATMPAFQRDNEDYVTLLVIGPGDLVMQYDRTPVPFRVESPFYAIGSGRDFAMAAMHLGKTAQQAVEVACEFDAGCGNGIDAMTLELS